MRHMFADLSTSSRWTLEVINILSIYSSVRLGLCFQRTASTPCSKLGRDEIRTDHFLEWIGCAAGPCP